MKGTKLWQQAHSPLIQGRSRRERPFFTEWLLACVLSLLIGGLAVYLLRGQPGVPSESSQLLQVWVIPGLAGAAIGAGFGVWLAEQMGWRPRWVTGLVAAVVLMPAAVWLAVVVFK
ncbi:MAG: hypothetical protein FDZ75_06010 [Actinobacteria bacterium]|nr:MAG: hypothetical protein FDZ75_06010 [Actinomycetota bacterium]